MISNYRKFLVLLAILTLLVSSFSNVVVTPPANAEGDLKAMMDDIARDVGVVVEVKDNGSQNPIIIFQENHASILGQVEIALMLQRLHFHYGVNLIGLEGAFEPIDVSWYHDWPTNDVERAGVAVRQLVEGEINNAEFIALVNPGVQVFGIENEKEYEDNHKATLSSNASLLYLVYFSFMKMSDAEQQEANQIMNTEGVDAFLEYCFSFDSWSAARYETISNPKSVEELLDVLDEIANKAEELRFNDYSDFDDLKAGLEEEREFYTLASNRSVTMVNKALDSIPQDNTPMPIIVGALHTEHVKKLIADAGYSYAVVEAASLQELKEHNYTVGMFSDFAYDRKVNQLSVDGPGGLGAILDGVARIKPRSSVQSTLVQRKLTCYLGFDQIAERFNSYVPPAFGDEPQPYGLGDVLGDLDGRGFVVSRNTIEFVPANPADPNGPKSIVFQVTLPKDGDEEAVTFWAKVFKTEMDADLEEQIEEAEDHIEPLLLAARQEVSEKTQGENSETEPPAPPVNQISNDVSVAVGAQAAQVINKTG